jgi:transglutaminase-like putative cysteine protease
MNRYHLVHVTEFRYDGPVSESYNELRLRPIQDDKQSCISFRLNTTPASRNTSFLDAYGNWAHQFNILQEHRSLRIEAESVVLTHDGPPATPSNFTLLEFDGQRDEFFEENYDFIAATEYVPHIPQLAEIVEAAERQSDGTVAGFSQAASNLIHQRFQYVKGATHVHSSIEDSLSLGAGVCQDFAHLLLGAVRMRGLAARYVSGYLVPGSADAGEAKQEEVIGGQASHAWTEILTPGSGWLAYDPTLGAPVGLRHVRVAYGRDYGDVAPVRGVYKGHAGQRLSVDVRVRPALDDDGHEQLSKSALNPLEASLVPERPQQAPQQQQQ